MLVVVVVVTDLTITPSGLLPPPPGMFVIQSFPTDFGGGFVVVYAGFTAKPAWLCRPVYLKPTSSTTTLCARTSRSGFGGS